MPHEIQDTQKIIEAGMAGQLEPGSEAFELFVDVTARRPGGESAKSRYRNPTEHFESFRIALETLDLRPDDAYLELGFGGGQLLRMVLASAARAAGLDHSHDMVTIASELNADAIAAGRLELVQGEVDQLPWEDSTFTCAAAVNMWFFVEDPDRTLRELARVLNPGGRLVIVTSAPKPGVGSGPWAPALRTYTAQRMEAMMRGAGFRTLWSVSQLMGCSLAAQFWEKTRPSAPSCDLWSERRDGRALSSPPAVSYATLSSGTCREAGA